MNLNFDNFLKCVVLIFWIKVFDVEIFFYDKKKFNIYVFKNNIMYYWVYNIYFYYKKRFIILGVCG